MTEIRSTMQLFVVTKPDKKSGAVSAVYVFDNHDAALRCRQGLGLSSHHLRGCAVFSKWENGEPWRKMEWDPLTESCPNCGTAAQEWSKSDND